MAAEIGPFRCPRCASATWGNLAFCAQCGESLNKECPRCGAGWRYILEYAYCPTCGGRMQDAG